MNESSSFRWPFVVVLTTETKASHGKSRKLKEDFTSPTTNLHGFLQTVLTDNNESFGTKIQRESLSSDKTHFERRDTDMEHHQQKVTQRRNSRDRKGRAGENNQLKYGQKHE